MPASTLTLGPHLKLRGRVGVYVLGPASAATAKKKKEPPSAGAAFPPRRPLGPQHHLVAHLDGPVDPARVQRRLAAVPRAARQHQGRTATPSHSRGRRWWWPRSMKNGVSSPPSVEAELLVAKTAYGSHACGPRPQVHRRPV